MKYTSLKAFEKHLEGAAPSNFAPVYLILGKDSGDRRIAIDIIVEQLKKTLKQGDLAFRSIQGDTIKSADLIRDLSSFSFFSAKEIITVHEVDALKKDAIDSLTTYFLKPNVRQILILSAAAINRSTNFYKNAEKTGVILEFLEEKAWEKEKTCAEWVGALVAAQGKKITASTALAFVKQIGLDRSLLKQEVDKVVCFAFERPEITANDIAAICVCGPLGNEWQLGEALMRCSAAEASRLGQDLLKNGNFFSLLRGLRTQMQNGLHMASILALGKGPEAIAAEFPYLKGFLLDQKVQLVRTFGLERFKRALQIIDTTELQAKNGWDDHALLADLMFVKLTG